MKKEVYLVCCACFAAAPPSAESVEFGVQPRFDTGVVYFKYDQESFAQRPASEPEDPVRNFPTTVKGITVKDVMPFVRGGVTFFADRFLVDVDIQHAFDGSDKTGFGSSNRLSANSLPGQTSDLLTITNNQLNADFDRTDYTVTVGFAVTESLVVYAGYKNAMTEINTDLRGQVVANQASDLSPAPFLTGDFTAGFDLDFEYDGPFIGGANSWAIDAGFLDGSLSANVGVAFLDGKTDLDVRNVNFTPTNQQPVDLGNVDVGRVFFNTSKLDGDAVGISLGLNWNGRTPLEGLNYLVGVNGYRYDFDGDNGPDFTDTLIRFSAGFQYAF